MPNPEAMENFAAWYGSHPDDRDRTGVPSAAHPAYAHYGQGNGHLRFGGDYWTITSSPDGFVALWIDNYANGVPQIWGRLLKVR
jgi:hypothetical protein